MKPKQNLLLLTLTACMLCCPTVHATQYEQSQADFCPAGKNVAYSDAVYLGAMEMSDPGTAVEVNALAVSLRNQWGEEIVPNGKYHTIGSFSEGGAWANSTEDATPWVFIDTAGNEVLRLDGYLSTVAGLPEFQEGLAAFFRMEDDRDCYVDHSGNVVLVLEEGLRGESFSEGFAVVSQFVSQNVLCGYIDKSGAVVIPLEYSVAQPFYHGRAVVGVMEDKIRSGLIDTQGDWVIPPGKYDYITQCEDQDLVILEKKTDEGPRRGVADLDGNIMIPLQYTGLFYSEGRFLMETSENDENGWGIFDLNGKALTPMIYTDIGDGFSEGLLMAKTTEDPRWRCLDTNGKTVFVLPDTYNDLTVSAFQDGLLLVGKSSYGDIIATEYIDRAGKTVLKFDEQIYKTRDFRGGSTPYVNQETRERGLLLDPRERDAHNPACAAEWAEAEELGLVTESNQHYARFRITRRRFAELAANLAEKATGKAITPAPADRFTDTDDVWVRKAAAIGVTGGVGDGTRFSPNSYITREQISAMLCRTVRYIEDQTGKTVLAAPMDLSGYTDAEQVGAFARQDVAALAATSIMKGTTATTLSPKRDATVEQAVLLTLRAYRACEN